MAPLFIKAKRKKLKLPKRLPLRLVFLFLFLFGMGFLLISKNYQRSKTISHQTTTKKNLTSPIPIPKNNLTKEKETKTTFPQGFYLEDSEDRSEVSFLVSRVIDGDTFELSDGRKVRLIGIDSPEKDQYYYLQAKNKLKELIEGKMVYLEKDISETDKYGRLLRYVWLDDLFVNLEMVKSGYATSFSYPPDIRYQSLFLQAESKAREKGLGLWGN